MSQLLKVVTAFGPFTVGQIISDPGQVALVLAAGYGSNVTDGSALVAAADTLITIFGPPNPALVGYTFALDLTSTPNTLYKRSGVTWAIVLQAGVVGGGVAPAVPANTAAPSISGTAQVGQALACSSGTWTGTPTAFAYQWWRNGAGIANATGAGYTPVAADIGALLTCAVTASNAGGASQAAVSAATSAVAAAPIVPVLQVLGLSSLNATAGVPFSAAISGLTAGSTIAATSSDGAALAVANGQVSGTFATAGSPTLTLTETLAGATGSPKATQLAMTVSAVAPAQPAGIGADLNDAMNTTFL